MTDASAGPTRPQAQGGVVTLANGQTRQLAGMWFRLLARIIDWIIAGALVTILFAVGFLGEAGDESFWNAFVNTDNGQTWRVILFGLLYEVLLVGFLGRTVGKMVMGIKVVKVSNGHVPWLIKGLIRWAILIGILAIVSRAGGVLASLTGLAYLLIYLSPLFNRARQGWHDMLASTVVIKTRSE